MKPTKWFIPQYKLYTIDHKIEISNWNCALYENETKSGRVEDFKE